MMHFKRTKYSGWLAAGILFVASLLWFGIFNRYHILNLEQNSLFLFSVNFLKESFSAPGGLASYAGSFLAQFFISAWGGAFISATGVAAIYLLSDIICRRHNIRSPVIAMVPAWMIIMMQSNELFGLSQFTGILLLLVYFTGYSAIATDTWRYISGLVTWPLLYLLAGGFALPAILICILYELLYRRGGRSKPFALLLFLEGAIIPYGSSLLLFTVPALKTYTIPVVQELSSLPLYFMIAILMWFPLLQIVFALPASGAALERMMHRRKTAMSALILMSGLMIFSVIRFGYNRNTEMLLGIDYNAQHQDWEKLLEISSGFPYPNRLVIYYTDLALSRTGHLLDHLFDYPQTGSEGLRLRFEHNANLLYGGDVFYYLGYTSEADRWAFEAMVAMGMTPVVLKRLISTSIINGETEIALRYLGLLRQTLFYRSYADGLIAVLRNPGGTVADPDISRNRKLLPETDFVSNPFDLNLIKLLQSHQDNKMAYEYLLASLLLDRNLDAFMKVFAGFGAYGYERIPANVEEALLLYSLHDNRNPLPPGYSISPETISRFREYSALYAASRDDRKKAASALRDDFGNTYWYYVQFLSIN